MKTNKQKDTKKARINGTK